MFFLIIIVLLKVTACLGLGSNVGSVFFNKRSTQKCWDKDYLARLRSRMIFENLALPPRPPEKINAKYNRDTIKYFRGSFHELKSVRDRHQRAVLKQALADTIGAHMRKEILPNARLAYYAGYVPYRTVRDLHTYYDTVKSTLNTKGHGWQRPERIPDRLPVDKIDFDVKTDTDPCAKLIVKRHDKDCIHIPTPKVDDSKQPQAISLPYKTGGYISLTSPNSENALLKFYSTAAQCILKRSPERCLREDFATFNNQIWHWMKRNVAPHLTDEKLYAGYGGVLRVVYAAQTYGKGLSRRQIFQEDYDYSDRDTFTPNHRLSSMFPDNLTGNWSQSLCVLVIFGAALAVCCMHIVYNFICGPTGGCNCPKSGQYSKRDLAYSLVESSKQGIRPNSHQPRPVHTFTQQVALRDSNKATKKPHPVAVQTYTDTETSALEDNATHDNKIIVGSIQIQTTHKLPRINLNASSELLTKVPRKEVIERTPNYTTTSTVRTGPQRVSEKVTYSGQNSESFWSGSFSSEESGTTYSTKSHSRKTSSKDTEWARKLISKQNQKPSTVTILDRGIPSPTHKIQ